MQDATADGLVEKAVLRKHLAEVSAMKFSPSGEFLATGGHPNGGLGLLRLRIMGGVP